MKGQLLHKWQPKNIILLSMIDAKFTSKLIFIVFQRKLYKNEILSCMTNE